MDTKNQKESNSLIIIVLVLALLGLGGYVILSKGSSNSLENTQVTNLPNTQATNLSSVFYTQVAANVRSCASTSCASLGIYPVNTELPLSYASLTDLPEWVQISPPDSNGVIQTGYINKSTLGMNKVSINPKQQEQQPTVPTYAAPIYKETNSSCKFKAEGVLNSSWIRTCNLRGQLTYQCQQIFDADGYHKNFPQVGDQNFTAKFGQVLDDIAACECQLPPDIVANLRYTQQTSNNSCDKFYPK